MELSVLLGWLAVSMLAPARTAAEGIHGSARLGYARNENKTSSEGGPTTETDTDYFLQRYNLLLEKSVYPNLRLRLGGIYEIQTFDAETDGDESWSEITKLNPLAEVRAATRLYSAELGYNRREEDTRTKILEQSPGSLSKGYFDEVRETKRALLAWRPDGFPSIEGRFLRTDTFDESREREDRTDDLYSLYSRYRPIDEMEFRYRLNYRDRNDYITQLGSEELTHSANFSYLGNFWNGRFVPSVRYTVTRRELDTTAADGGEIPIPQTPVGGLSIIDETPDEGALDDTPALIDGNFEASAGVNLGRFASEHGDRDLRNIGLELDPEAPVNTLYVSIDPTLDLPDDVASSFTWDVWISSDNVNWTQLGAGHGETIYKRFDNRFEIRFADVTTRYIKVTTRPLSLTVPLPPGTDLDNIFVTEIEAFLTETVAAGKTKTANTSQVGNVNATLRLMDSPFVSYDFSYWFADSGRGLRDVLSNGLSVRHILRPDLAVSGRFAVENGHDAQGDRLAVTHSGSLNYNPLGSRLRHILSYSGKNEDIDGEQRSEYSVILRNYAELYKGVDLSLSGGANSASTQGTLNSLFYNLGLRLEPHRALTLQLGYLGRETTSSGAAVQPSKTTQSAHISAQLTPLRSLRLLAELNTYSESDRPDRTAQSYEIAWAPFPDGKIQLSFNYDETYLSLDSRTERTVGPGLRWNLARGTVLNVSYLIIDIDSDTSSEKSKLANADLYISF